MVQNPRFLVAHGCFLWLLKLGAPINLYFLTRTLTLPADAERIAKGG